ncbi:MAG: GTP 3',8-cyclase MoaA [Deltaproteobacteria bacterium]|nr:GTP 3',8-cyclase MoaA [Deltaproteobacteria bacterium]MCB9789158.1 GTP 3',8-cyclase MoaA [Deltaproteobacteria bacterium]
MVDPPRTPADDPGSPQAPAPTRVPLASLGLGRTPGVPPAPPALVDGHRRPIHYLRLSVTDRCSFRCVYCMPTDGVSFVPRAEVLTYEEMVVLVRCFVALGIHRIRLTGGEPLLRRDLPRLVRALAAIDGVDDLAMTTNGYALAPLAGTLREAGLRRLNISIDTLDAARFARITRTGTLDRVLDGIDAACAAGFGPIKLNAVIVRGFNDDELVPLVRFAAARGAVMRFIEYMPIGVDGFWTDERFMATDAMLERLGDAFAIEDPVGYGPSAGIAGEGPAVYRDLTPRGGGAPTRVGFISAVSHGFCSTCNRVRMTAVGTLQECLAHPGQLSLRDALRAGADEDTLTRMIADALWDKSSGHAFAPTGGGRVMQTMSVTGG